MQRHSMKTLIKKEQIFVILMILNLQHVPIAGTLDRQENISVIVILYDSESETEYFCSDTVYMTIVLVVI